MQESAVSIFRKLPETKDQVKQFASLVKESILDGEVDILRTASNIRALEEVIKLLKNDVLIKDCILEEAEKNGRKTFDLNNCQYQIKEVGAKYDFTVCNDDQWEDATKDELVAKTKRTDREKFLKSITPDMEVFNSDGVKLETPIKKSTTSVVITLK